MFNACFFFKYLYNRSPEWKSIPANSLQFPNKDDGEFYVCLEDFMKYFSHTTICSLTPDFDMDGCSDSLSKTFSVMIRII